jgi:hypothetical protein
MARISVPELGSRGDSAGITALGLAAVIAWAWFPYRALIIAGATVAVLGAASLTVDLRRGRAWHEQDVMIRRLWAAAKRIPSDVVLTDTGTGELLTVERERGWLTLAVNDPPGPGGQPIVTRYPLGQWAAPNPPPLYRHLAALGDIPPARWRWQQKSRLAYYNRQAGALEVTPGELAGLTEQLGRAAAAP